MNRSTALFLALALLLAHMLAIHHDLAGSIGPPCDEAHVTYRLARNLVHQGVPAFNPESAPLEHPPSWTWLGFSAAAEQLEIPVTNVCQAVGILCALATVIVLAQFSPRRMSGIIAPALLVVNGGMAAMAGDGTEGALFTLILVLAFLALERGSWRALGLFLALLSATRQEGVLLAVAFFALSLASRPRTAFAPLHVLIPPLLVAVLLALPPGLSGAGWLPPDLATLLDLDRGRAQLGLASAWDLTRTTASPLLLPMPLALLAAGRLSALGRRALAIALTGSLIAIVQGGSRRPFGIAFAPYLPMLFVAVQESVTTMLDARRKLVEGAVWVALAITLVASSLASKLPGAVGPLPVEGLIRSWRRASPLAERAYGPETAREALFGEIRATRRLRSLGIFLRDEVPPSATVLSPWPGAVAYLSRKRVYDLLGRATIAVAGEPQHSWRGPPRIDLLAVLGRRADYLIPSLAEFAGPTSVREVAQEWLRRYDLHPDDPTRLDELLKAFAPYELIAVPFPTGEPVPEGVRNPLLLLRRRNLGLGPRLEIALEGRAFRVLLRHTGHAQLGDLALYFEPESGGVRAMRPTGSFEVGRTVLARTDLLLHPTGTLPVELLRSRVPSELGPGRVTALLVNPGAPPEADLHSLSNSAGAELR